MSEMVERVAKALAACDCSPTWEGYVQDARAAIAAMKEPTEAMMDAAEDTNRGGGYGDNGGIEADRYDPEEVWRAMIDAALR